MSARMVSLLLQIKFFSRRKSFTVIKMSNLKIEYILKTVRRSITLHYKLVVHYCRVTAFESCPLKLVVPKFQNYKE